MKMETPITRQYGQEYLAAGYWRGLSMGDIVRQHANASYPGREAIVDSRCRLTWEEVDRMTDRVAANLVAAGLGKGDFLALLLPPRAEASILAYGAARAGVVFYQLGLAHSEKEICATIEATQTRGVVTVANHGDVDYGSVFAALQTDGPLEHVWVLDGDVRDAMEPVEH